MMANAGRLVHHTNQLHHPAILVRQNMAVQDVAADKVHEPAADFDAWSGRLAVGPDDKVSQYPASLPPVVRTLSCHTPCLSRRKELAGYPGQYFDHLKRVYVDVKRVSNRRRVVNRQLLGIYDIIVW